jgi:hypothetical protein
MGCLVRADSAFGTFPISGIALPGSLNAGTFNLDPQSFDTQPGSACSTYTPSDATIGAEFARWTEAQDETITEQLDRGIRVLDLNVAYNGNGSASTGWRVVNTQFSEWPLYDDLDQIANWAKAHPSEVVIVDLRTVCYDNGARGRLASGLWSSFSTRSNVGGGPATLDQVAFDPTKLESSLARTSIDQVEAQTGRHVVILLPRGVADLGNLTSKFHVHAITVSAGHSPPTASGSLTLEYAVAGATPVSPADIATADAKLASYPLGIRPALGSLVGSGLYETNLAYSFDPTAQAMLFKNFEGLIDSPTESRPSAATPAWESILMAPGSTGSSPRNSIASQWGHRANIVLSDGIEYGGFIAAVIGDNAKSH